MNIRAILIHRNEQGEIVATEHTINQNSLDDMYRLIKCDTVDRARSISGNITAWVDDEGLLNDSDDLILTDCTDLLEDSDEGSFCDNIVLAGNILLTGGCDDEGNTLGLPESVTSEHCISNVQAVYLA